MGPQDGANGMCLTQMFSKCTSDDQCTAPFDDCTNGICGGSVVDMLKNTLSAKKAGCNADSDCPKGQYCVTYESPFGTFRQCGKPCVQEGGACGKDNDCCTVDGVQMFLCENGKCTIDSSAKMMNGQHGAMMNGQHGAMKNGQIAAMTNRRNFIVRG